MGRHHPAFANALPHGARVLDAGAGEGGYKNCFARQAYMGVDLGIGDTAWNYSELDTVADLQKIATALAERGYSSSDVDAITHENWLRVLRRSLP